MAEKISINEVEPGSTVMLAGKLNFSRLTSLIQGEELERRNEKARSLGIPTQERPYTTLTMSEVEIVPQNADGTLTKAEEYIRGTLFKSNDPNKPGWHFSINDRSVILPSIAKRNADGVVEQIYPDKELAAGQDVFVIVRIYKGKMSNGKSLDAVIVDSAEPQFFGDNSQGGRLADTLSKYGLTFKSAPNPNAEGVGEMSDAQKATVRTLDATAIDTYDAEPYVAEEELMTEEEPPVARPGIRFQQ